MREPSRFTGQRIGSSIISLAIVIALFTIPEFYKIILLSFILLLAFGSIGFFRDRMF